jgi:stage II sporulation protein P
MKTEKKEETGMNKKITGFILLTLLMVSIGGLARAEMEAPSGEYYSMVNEQNNIVHQTALEVQPGDIYIAADNSKYVVVEVNGYTARCVYQGKEEMPVINDDVQVQAGIFDNAVPIVKKGSQATIAVYHTHSDESYVPNDGKESIPGKGGIYDVGQAFVDKLKSMGFNVQYNQENHNPHDVNAYNRSRKTASSLLKTGPDAIIDVHRDAVPPGEYQTQVNGQQATKVKLVVGKSNPNMTTTMEFAKTLKAAMDKKYPGLSDGIFVGKGAYNQDLSPRAMLIEVGAHTNDKDAAEKGVQAFAEILPTVLGVSADGSSNANDPASKPMTGGNQKSWTAILIILAVVAAAVAGFYFLNRGSISKSR